MINSQLTPFGKRALISGGNRGIGLGAAEVLAAAGCDIVISSASDKARGEKEAARIQESLGVRAFALQVDIADPAAARNFVREGAELLGGLDIVVCNAGICHFKPIMEVTDADWQKHVDINLSGSFYVAQESAKIMLEQGQGGRIIFTASVGSFRSNSGQTHYCATKGGQNVLMQGMALELGPRGITVNSVAPGWIHTDINDAPSRDPQVTEPWIQSRCAVRRLGEVEDLKGAYLLLASKEAAYMNGSTITVDGGWLAQL